MSPSPRVDFIVVGAGIAGASVASALAERGSVVVLDMEEHAGYHTTGRSAALYSTNARPRLAAGPFSSRGSPLAEPAPNEPRLLIGRFQRWDVMLRLKDLNSHIARLELRIEQLRIHLQSLGRASAEATEVRLMLYAMLQELVSRKELRETLEAELDLHEAA